MGESVRDRWRITEIEAGRLLTGREMKRQLQCSKEPIKVSNMAPLSQPSSSSSFIMRCSFTHSAY